MLLKGVAHWNKSGAISSPDLREADLQRAKLYKANLRGADLHGANLRGAFLERVNLSGADLTGANLREAQLDRADLQGADLQGAALQEANLKNVNLRLTNLTAARLQRALLTHAALQEANLQGALLHLADLQDANLNGADLRGAKLKGSSLSGADLAGTRFDQNTDLSDVRDTSRCIMDAYALECLGRGYGGLTNAQRMDMIIKDDAAELHFEFSGIRRWIHIISIGVFLAPYGLFLINAQLTTTIGHSTGYPFSSGKTPTIWEGLWSYFSRGGYDTAEPVNYWIIASAIAMILYNLVRFALLKESVDLEHRKDLSGLLQRFSFRDLLIERPKLPPPKRDLLKFIKYKLIHWSSFYKIRYGHLLRATKILFWVAMAAVIYNSHVFLNAPYPPKDALWQHIKTEKAIQLKTEAKGLINRDDSTSAENIE